jgi:hypothetical protein
MSGAAVTTDNLVLADWSQIQLNTVTGAFTESGLLQIATFQLGGSSLSNPAGFNVNPGYQLYFTFTASGTLGPCGLVICGAFSTLNYTFLGDQGGKATFSNAGVTTNGDTQITLASGTLLNPGIFSATNQALISNGVPSAQVLTTFVEDPAQLNFFVAPKNMTLDLNSAFTNNSNQVTQGPCSPPSATCTTYTITNGGGSASFLGTSVPEPMTISMFGFGLLMIGAGVARRRRAA